MSNMEDLFKCPVCEVVSGNKSSLLSHVDKHKGFPLSCITCHSSFKNKFSYDCHLVSELCKKSNKCVGQLRQCPQCPQTFPNRRHLNKHVDGHRRNNCQYCDARFTTRKEVTLHMAQEHKMKLQKSKYQCQFCERCFVKQVTLFNHYNQHANGKFVCQSCGLFLDSKAEFETHKERHELERPWKCTRCGTTFSRRQQYVVHMESHEKYQCKTCNVGFAAKATLQEHSRVCQNQSGKESQYECPECGKVFSRQGQLTLHLKAHTGEEAYTCLVCKSGFQTAEDYNQHIRSTCHEVAEDDPNKTHKCEQCDRSFSQANHLVEHMNQLHGATRSYKCNYCEHSSNSRANMTRHLALHTERCRFVCDQCGAAFHALTTLKDHCNSVHSEYRNFCCTTCKKTFKLQNDLRRHIRSHSDMRPFKCQYCTQAYKRASHLRRHEESIHGAIFKPRRLQRLGRDETCALVRVVDESKSSSGGMKEETSVVPQDHLWTSAATSQSATTSKASVFTNPVLSLVDADSGKVITLQELCTVSEAQILTTTGNLSTAEVLTLPPDDTLATIVTCTDGTTLDSFQSGEVLQTIEVTYDLTFPTSQTLTTVLSSSEPQLVFATPITMSLDEHSTVLTVSEVHPTGNLNGKVQLLDPHDASKLPDTIFIEEGKLEGLEEAMLLDSIEPARHITLENFSALDDGALQTQVGMTASSAVTLPNLPNSVESVLQLCPERLPVSKDCTVLSDGLLTSSSLLRERLMCGPKLRSSALQSLHHVPSQCNDDLDAITVTSIPFPANVTDSSTQPHHAVSTPTVSFPFPSASTDGSHLDSMLSISNSTTPSYASINVESANRNSVITSFCVPNSIHSSCTDISTDGTKTDSSISQLSVPDSVLQSHTDIRLRDTCASSHVTSVSVTASVRNVRAAISSAGANHDSSISAYIVPNSSASVGSGISYDTVDLIHPLCQNISGITNDSETISTLTIPSSVQSSRSDIDSIPTGTSVSAPSVGAVDVSISETGIHPSCTISLQPQDASVAVEGTPADLTLAPLPVSTQRHPS
ncbi:uncharacterized protein LOC110835081 isoform X2 [Zootermopsis nevadensis]|uniref:uncharacterized protein LOC110835081 isoform X2 n=1 Tax=Zootermopsis nevadensis TaxID=136037 RepID=UPI000B8EB226|nr:uncharacterized protein LOC110835081 isoform X2 [Zootermopsis nevadensis]